MEKKETFTGDFLAKSSHDVRSKFRSFLLELSQNLSPGTIAAKKDGGKEFLAPRQRLG